jgi:spermidine/putrescine transport system permease protein
MLVFLALYVPILTLVGIQLQLGSHDGQLGGFSLRWYQKAWANEDVKDATLRSLTIAGFAAVFSTVAGHDGGTGHHAPRQIQGADLHLCDDQPAA